MRTRLPTWRENRRKNKKLPWSVEPGYGRPTFKTCVLCGRSLPERWFADDRCWACADKRYPKWLCKDLVMALSEVALQIGA